MPQKNDTIIELKSITKRYGFGDAESFALRNFDLTVKRGEFIMIMGPSGCGKTTLLNILGLIDAPTSGDYLLDGKLTAKINDNKKAALRAKKIGFIFQNFNLIPNIPIIDNVCLPLVYAGIPKTRRLKQADEVLERFHLREREYYMPHQLSGGQQQRVAIARSLISKPSIILADEPTGNLDSRSSHIVMEELRDIHAQGNTIIMVTHNPALTTYATRVIHMLDGEIDTDIKTVDDANLPGARSEKISVHITPKKNSQLEIAIDSKAPVTISGKNLNTKPADKPSTKAKTPKDAKTETKADAKETKSETKEAKTEIKAEAKPKTKVEVKSNTASDSPSRLGKKKDAITSSKKEQK